MQLTLIKLPLKEVIAQSYDVHLTQDEVCDKEYLITQSTSLLFDQIARIRGFSTSHISELLLISAKKNPRQEQELRRILNQGFSYNGTHYRRFGKSASQGKDGITAFVCDSIYELLYCATQMDISVEHCVISKYEAQRCLVFSSCTLIPDYMPRIIIIDEYKKELSHQWIRYVTERKKTFTDPETNEERSYQAREVEEGFRDIPLSPFDGCGCHERDFMERTSAALGLDYLAVGSQIRLPFLKGYSVYVPFRQILKEWGCTTLTDIYGQEHSLEDIDCIWNISMFKGHSIFKKQHGSNAWNAYLTALAKYQYKLGISKYSHHVKNFAQKSRMNFQYLQCLDLWNPGYIKAFQQSGSRDYDILSPQNKGKIIALAEYTSRLYERIIKGDAFYTCKFLGITNTDTYQPESRYAEAVLINSRMLQDPAVKQFIHRKLKKAIQEAKLGKIYAEGFYHTVVGDMIGYLQYAAGQTPTGCLKAKEFFSETLPKGKVLSFRSPLVCPSEVNDITLVSNRLTDQWFSYFKDQDLVMINMYDLSAPQQGGMDQDGDAVFLCCNPIITASKIQKPIIIDMDDKATTNSRTYTLENLTEYELNSRDNRIGEITNVATSIENKYTDNPQLEKLYSDFASLLRIFQGKEIDFLKTGFRWQMNRGLRKYLNQLPWFLLYNYPQKLKTWEALQEKNKAFTRPEEKLPLNAYRSPSPMNELCSYICSWEKKKIIWDHSAQDTGDLLINHSLNLTDRQILRTVRRFINAYTAEFREHIQKNSSQKDTGNLTFHMNLLVERYQQKLRDTLGLEEELIANYVICVSYRSLSISKNLAWAGYGDYLMKNLKENSTSKHRITITELASPTGDALEYLGKYYEYKED